MKHETHGILALFLVAGIGMTMLLSFGVRAMTISAQARVAPGECQYSQLILAAKHTTLEP